MSEADLAKANARAKRAAAGPPLSQTETDLDALSGVGPERLGEAEMIVRELAGRVGLNMFNAQGEAP